MGTLFPDDPEYPDHKPVASPLGDLKIAKNVAPAMILTMALHDLCPLGTPIVDPPQKDHAPVTRPIDAISVNSTTPPPTPFNQYNWPVPPRRTLNPSQMVSSTNAALLYYHSSSGR